MFSRDRLCADSRKTLRLVQSFLWNTRYGGSWGLCEERGHKEWRGAKRSHDLALPAFPPGLTIGNSTGLGKRRETLSRNSISRASRRNAMRHCDLCGRQVRPDRRSFSIVVVIPGRRRRTRNRCPARLDGQAEDQNRPGRSPPANQHGGMRLIVRDAKKERSGGQGRPSFRQSRTNPGCAAQLETELTTLV